jgi:uncharacterized membrane protein YqiK
MEYAQFALTGWLVVSVLFLIWFWNSLYVIKEWERGVVLRLGRMLPEAKLAGLRLVFWPIEKLYRMPLRIETLDVPPQDIIIRDNVSVKVNAVCYFRVVDANLALSQVQNYLYATSQKAQTGPCPASAQKLTVKIIDRQDNSRFVDTRPVGMAAWNNLAVCWLSGQGRMCIWRLP